MARSGTSRITALELVFIFAGGILPLARAEDLILVPRESTWRYFRGLEEASSPDTGLWRLADFDDSRWDSGPAPFGYGDPPYGTDLSLLEPPMLGNYTSVFLRHRFAEDEVSSLIEYHLRADYDDGFIAWINGIEVLRVNVAGERGSPVAFNGRASRSHESGSFETFVLPSVGADADYVKRLRSLRDRETTGVEVRLGVVQNRVTNNPVSNHAFFFGGGGGPSPASAATRGLPLLGA